LKTARLAALGELVAAGEAQEQRKGKTVRYWLQGLMPVPTTPEEMADEVLRRVLPEQRRGRLFTQAKIQSELLEGLGIKAPAVQTCLRLLEQQRLLVKLSDGTKTYFAYAPALRAWLDEGSHPELAPAIAPSVEAAPSAGSVPQPSLPLVIDAYRSVRAQRRMPDVEIARLQEVMGCTPSRSSRWCCSCASRAFSSRARATGPLPARRPARRPSWCRTSRICFAHEGRGDSHVPHAEPLPRRHHH